MKEIKLTIDGREVKLTKEQIHALGIEVDGGCVCDRVASEDAFYYVESICDVAHLLDYHATFANALFKSGNYYRDESFAKQVAMHQMLNNLLRRYSEQHGGDAEWDGSGHYLICLDTSYSNFYVSCYNVPKICGVVYFNSKEVAKAAIEEVVKPFLAAHPDFVW